MHDSEMHERAGEESPPLAPQRQRAEVRAKIDGLLGSRLPEGNTAKDHECEDQHVYGNQGHRYGKGRMAHCLGSRN